MTRHQPRHGLLIAAELAGFVETRLLPGLGVAPDGFWQGLRALCTEFAAENRRLLERRRALQQQIDGWHIARRGQKQDAAAYRDFLIGIGYLAPPPPPFVVATTAVDPEIATLAGPQLVVPVNQARLALQAANARWGSLSAALHGTDALGAPPDARAVKARLAAFLDDTFPLTHGSHAAATAYLRDAGGLLVRMAGQEARLSDPSAFAGSAADGSRRSYYLRHHGLHVELRCDPAASGLCDVVLEAALTAIQDCADSVAAVDAADKVQVYANWLGLMTGGLHASCTQDGLPRTLRLAGDRRIVAADGRPATLPGRALLMVRHVGLLMTTDAVLHEGREIPENLLDALVTVTCALHDLRRACPRNSRCGAVYVVQPKLHGPEEAAFTDRLFGRVEQLLGLPPQTVKLGLMDEERRTSANLAACIHALRDRIVFIGTGLPNRTGDEIHSAMQAGPVLPRSGMRAAPWRQAHADGTIRCAIHVGLIGRGQIGTGMWAKPAAMAEMMARRIADPAAGAGAAAVPGPMAATLHALHFHQVDVTARQQARAREGQPDLAALLIPPLMTATPDPALIQRELDSRVQAILGYVGRWVDQGIGWSTLPDIDDVPRLADRAACRSNAQFLANWLLHGLIGPDALEAALRRMALRVDAQNAGDPARRPMAPGFDGPAFRAARDLILTGAAQPSGYADPLLHAWRREAKRLQPRKEPRC